MGTAHIRQRQAHRSFLMAGLLLGGLGPVLFAVPGEAQQQSPAPAPPAAPPPAATPPAPAPPPPPAAPDQPEIPSSMAEIRKRGRDAIESIVMVSDQLRNMAMIARQEGDIIRGECIDAKRQHARTLVAAGWEQMGKLEDALKAQDGLRATYNFMTLDSTRAKSQDLLAEAHACVGSRTEGTGRTEVSVTVGPGPDDRSGPDLQRSAGPIDRPPAASPYK